MFGGSSGCGPRAARRLAAGDPARAATLLRHALALWRGPALADVMYEPFAQAEAARLEELRLRCLEAQVDADLALGRHADVVGELELLIDQHGDRERLRGQLMLALYRSGRQEEALEVYRQTRRRLVDELGLRARPGAAVARERDPQPRPSADLDAAASHGPERAQAGPHLRRSRARARSDHGWRRGSSRGTRLARSSCVASPGSARRGSPKRLPPAPPSGAPSCCPAAAGSPAGRRLLAVGAVSAQARATDRTGHARRPARHRRGGRRSHRSGAPRAGPETATRRPPSIPTVRASVSSTPSPRCFAMSARTRPIVLVLDDLHAADAASLLLLRFLTDTLADTPTARDRDTTRQRSSRRRESLAATVAELARSETFHDVASGRARAGGGRAAGGRGLGARGASDALVAAIHERTEGHPFFVAELVRLLASEGRLDAIPQGVRAVVAQRLGLLSEDCRRVLALPPSSAATSQATCSRAPATPIRSGLSDLLGEAMRSQGAGARCPALPGSFRFAHALVREVLYDELSMNAPHRASTVPWPKRSRRSTRPSSTRTSPSWPTTSSSPRRAAPHGRALDYAVARGRARNGRARIRGVGAPVHDGREGTRARRPAPTRPVRCGLLLGLAAAQASANDMISAKETFVRAADVARARRACSSSWPAPRSATAAASSRCPADDARIVPLLEEALAALGENDGVLRAQAARPSRVRRPAGRREPRGGGARAAARRPRDAGLGAARRGSCSSGGRTTSTSCIALAEEIIAVAERAQDVEQALNGHLLRSICGSRWAGPPRHETISRSRSGSRASSGCRRRGLARDRPRDRACAARRALRRGRALIERARHLGRALLQRRVADHRCLPALPRCCSSSGASRSSARR